jgi:hypothetical protein
MSEPVGWQWIEAWRNGTISDNDFESLQKLLRDQPEARRTLRRSMMMDTALRDHAEARMLAVAIEGTENTQGNETPSPARATVASGSRFTWREAIAWSAAAASLLLATTIWLKRPATAPSSSWVASSQPASGILRIKEREPATVALTIADQRKQLLASAPDVLHLQLVNDSGSGVNESGGDIAWSSGRQIGYLRLRGLANTDSAGRQYQLWIVGSDVSGNEIINGGAFPVDQSTGELIFPILADQFVQQPMMFVVDVEPSANGTALPISLVAKADSG